MYVRFYAKKIVVCEILCETKTVLHQIVDGLARFHVQFFGCAQNFMYNFLVVHEVLGVLVLHTIWCTTDAKNFEQNKSCT